MRSQDLLEKIYCQFSLAMSYAQGIERSLITLLMTRERGDSEMLLENFLALENIWAKTTLGGLIGEIHRKMGRSSRISDLLEQALKARNYLVHHFFWDRAECLADPKMHEGLLAELRQMTELFQRTSDELDAIIRRCAFSAWSEEEYEERVDALMAELISRTHEIDAECATPRSS